MTVKELEDRVRGALYGFAIGDAMGATTEFMRAKDIATYYGKVTEIVGGGWLDLKPGLATDDTDMMMCVANAIISSKNDEDALNKCCENFAKWYKSKPSDIGLTCKRVISRCLGNNDYKHWHEVARDPRGLGNGSLMRTLPCILLGQSEVFSTLQGRLTHNNVQCDSVIITYHKLMVKALKGEYAKSRSTYDFKPDPLGNAYDTLRCAKYWMSKSRTFEDVILGAVNDGGDADTIAAIAGSLAGAYYGFGNIPQRWIIQLDVSVIDKVEKIFKIFNKKYVHIVKSVV